MDIVELPRMQCSMDCRCDNLRTSLQKKEERSVYFYVSCQPVVSRDHKGSESIFFDLN